MHDSALFQYKQLDVSQQNQESEQIPLDGQTEIRKQLSLPV